MKIGPIAPSVVGQNPLKALRTKTAGAKQQILFGTTHPHSLATDAMPITIECKVFAGYNQASASRALVQQLIELGHNTEWHRCGVFITCREDGVLDASDGFYNFEGTDLPEETLDGGWLTGRIDVVLRGRQPIDLRSFVDAKAQPNDANLTGTTLAAFPQGLGTPIYPASTYTFAAADGSTISVVENPASVLRAPFSSPANLMTLGRCKVTDENSGTGPSTVATEVFWVDHRNLNGFTRITNGLVRYTMGPSWAETTIEAWSGTAWVPVGYLLIQAYNPATSTYTFLPLQGYSFTVISPEEVVWEEIRYDSASTSLVRITNRIRRGSRLIESQIVCASGQGLTGQQSVSLLSIPAGFITYTSADGTGVIGGGGPALPGFCYLTAPTLTPAVATIQTYNSLASGLSIAPGAVARVGILAGYSDAQYQALTSLYGMDTGGSLAGWTLSGSNVPTIDNGLGNPSPSYNVPANGYAYRALASAATHYEFDVYIPSGSLCDFFLCCNATGAGTILRLDARGGNSSGFATSTSWTAWTAPSTGPTLTAAVWHHVTIDIVGNVATAMVDGVALPGNIVVDTTRLYFGMIGDGVSGAHFDNLLVWGQGTGTQTVYAGRWASINRTRVRQRLMIS